MPMVPPALPVLIQFASPSVRANWGAPKPFEFSLYFVKGEGRVGVGWVAIARGIQLERGVSLTLPDLICNDTLCSVRVRLCVRAA